MGSKRNWCCRLISAIKGEKFAVFRATKVSVISVQIAVQIQKKCKWEKKQLKRKKQAFQFLIVLKIHDIGVNASPISTSSMHQIELKQTEFKD